MKHLLTALFLPVTALFGSRLRSAPAAPSAATPTASPTTSTDRDRYKAVTGDCGAAHTGPNRTPTDTLLPPPATATEVTPRPPTPASTPPPTQRHANS